MALRGFVFGLAVLFSTSAFAEPWTGPTPGRRAPMASGTFGDGSESVDFGLAEVCFPYVIQNAAVESITIKNGVIANKKESDDRGVAFFLGSVNHVVWLKERDGNRSCTLRIGRGDPQKVRAAVAARMAQWPAELSPSKYQYAPNAYATREFFCAPAAGPHDTALISTAKPDDKAVALMVTVGRESRRSERCDGVAPPDARNPNPPPVATDPNGVELHAWAVLTEVCKTAVLEKRPVDGLLRPRSDFRGGQPASGGGDPGAWMLYGDLTVLEFPNSDCRIGVIQADPLVLRETINQAAMKQGFVRGIASGFPTDQFASTDVWCLSQSDARYALIVQATSAKDDKKLEGMLRLVQLAADNTRCPPARR